MSTAGRTASRALAGMLAGGPPAEASAAERESLARCALVRIFDKKLFDQYLRADKATTLGKLVQSGWIEVAGDYRRSHLYRITPRLRGPCWDSWWTEAREPFPSVPKALADLSARLAEHYRGTQWQVERLRQLVVANRGRPHGLVTEIRDLFDKIYADADGRFDLARCQDAVDALTDEGRASLLPPPLKDAREAHQLRIRARMAWATDYHLTSEKRYQSRGRAQDTLRRIVAPGPPDRDWLLQLYGPAGVGKTMLLRWLIAQVCVGQEQGEIVACARIDGDAIEPLALLENPWLLLLEAADQLNEQLPQGPFVDLLDEFSSYRGMLRRVPQGPWITGTDDRRLADVAREVESRFRSALTAGQPVLIALDTLDDLVTHSRLGSDRLQELINLLGRARPDDGSMSVVLAGRDDLRSPELVPRLGSLPGAVHLALDGFSDEEAAAYLRRRKVTGADTIAAITDGSKGLPFVLAIYADWANSDPNLTVAEIEQQARPQHQYILTKILKRISQPLVAWTLWYSVTPRSLTYEFFRDVMLPELRGQVTTGEARKPAVPIAGVPSETDIAAIRKAWSDVLASVREWTWISLEASAGQHQVVVHSLVRALLREQLRDDPTYLALHKGAVKHYDSVVGNAPAVGADPHESWLTWTQAIIFHLFQGQDPMALSRWREALAQARANRRLEWVNKLAEMLLGEDFQDAEGRPDENVISAQARYEAYVEIARVAAQAAGRLPGPVQAPDLQAPRWPKEAELRLDEARGLRESKGRVGQPIAATRYETILSALLLSDARDPDGAIKALGFLPAQAYSGDEQDASAADAALVRARAIAQAGPPPDADEHGVQAWLHEVAQTYSRSMDSYASDPSSTAYIALEAGDCLLKRERPDLALAWCDRVERGLADAAQWSHEAAALRASVLLALGRPGSALEALQPSAHGGLTTRRQLLAAQAHLELRQPRAALIALTTPADDGGESPGSLPELLLDLDLWLARTYGELLEIGQAQDRFEHAQSLIGPADDDGQARLNAARGIFELDVVGDVKRAALYLDQEVGPAWGTAAWTSLQLARLRLADRLERADEAGRLLAEILTALPARATIEPRVRAVIAGLAANAPGWRPRRGAYLALLASELARVTPDARLAMLTDLRRCATVEVDDHTVGRLCALAEEGHALAREGAVREGAPPAGRDMAQADGPLPEPDPLDQAFRDLTVADLLRVAGEADGAKRLRGRGVWTLEDNQQPRDKPFLRWDLMAVPGSDHDQIAAGSLNSFRQQYGSHPLLIAAFHTEWVSRYDDPASHEADHWLDEAEGRLTDAGRLTRYHARLSEVRAVRARSRGDLQAEERYEYQARQVWAELGDVRARLPVMTATASATAAPAADQGVPPDAGTPDAEGTTELILTVPGTGLVSVRSSDLGWPSDGPAQAIHVPQELADLGVDTQAWQWGQDVGLRLAPEVEPLLASAPAGSRYVRTDFPTGRLGDAPWELAEVDGEFLAGHPAVRSLWRGQASQDEQRHRVLFMQRALTTLGYAAGPNDGIPGPLFKGGLRAFHKATGSDTSPVAGPGTWHDPGAWHALCKALRERPGRRRELRVHLLQPVVGGNLDGLRYFTERVDMLSHAYRSAFGKAGRGSQRVALRRTSSSRDIAALLSGRVTVAPADVLHVCTVMAAGAQLPVLGLNLEQNSLLTAATLSGIIKEMTGDGEAPPLVVIDALPPPSPADARRHLLKRNRFAQQLLDLGAVETIIATGLAHEKYATGQWEEIVQGLAEGSTAAQICRRIQQLPRLGGPDQREAHAIACPATALFSNVHPEVMAEPGLLG